MTKHIEPVDVLETENTTQTNTYNLFTFKEALFQNMTAKEALTVFDKMTYDLLGSDYTEEKMYRGEILVLQSLIHKALIGIDKNISPDDIDVLQIEVQY